MKRLNIISILVFATSAISAQNYYYFRGEQMPLIEKDGNDNSRAINDESVFYDERGMELIPTGYLYVKLNELADSVSLQNLAQEQQLQIVNHDEYMPLWYTLQVTTQPKEMALSIANFIYETGDFAAAEPDFSFDALQISYDPDVRKQWNLCNMTSVGDDVDISRAWTYASGRGVKIAIIDNGIDVNHVDLKDNIIMTYNCDYSGYPIPVGDHGTHCAGIAAAVRNNGIFVTGVAPDAKIMAAGMDFRYPKERVVAGLARAINWASRNGADVISCSWSSPFSDKIADALDDAILNGRNGKGCIIVCAAGNAILDEWGNVINNDMAFPANYREEVIAVGATDVNGSLAIFSSIGDNMFICAPGDAIWSTFPNDEIAVESGTSMACPHVAGVVALMLERNPTLTIDEVRQILAVNTSGIPALCDTEENEFGIWSPQAGYGRVNAYEAIRNTPKP
ncbi:MAG: hypothetical protein E7082_07910 [Bacteroidales bacterium]|nr:hypothetical protein [Bacteroidales bacterium]